MQNIPKKIVLITTILQSTLLFSDYIDKSLPAKSFVYAPERENYLLEKQKEKTEKQKLKECFFCKANNTKKAKENDLIKSCEHHNVILAGFPYNKGHLLISSKRHIPFITDLTLEERLELLKLIELIFEIYKKALHADGANIGINVGKAGGASIPEHLHVHAVPRFSKDSPNYEPPGFMETACKTKVIDWNKERLRALLQKHFDETVKE